MLYFSPSRIAFFDTEIHGARTLDVPQPGWVPPDDDPEAQAPLVGVPNPACLIPDDAVEITEEQHQALMADQSGGKTIVAGDGGLPVAIDKPAPSLDDLANLARGRRDEMLSACDWVVTRALEVSEPVPAQWVTYRQALRDVSSQAGFPTTITWPTPPAA
jgi:hypothetical protein